jgi:uncharacterized protein
VIAQAHRRSGEGCDRSRQPSLLLVLIKAGALQWLTKRLADVGQTALSNYIGTSILCTLLFNGYGLGLFGKLQLSEPMYVVLGVWLVNLIVSPIWLKYFRFGTLEWGWRSLTYWKREPMSRQKSIAADLVLDKRNKTI